MSAYDRFIDDCIAEGVPAPPERLLVCGGSLDGTWQPYVGPHFRNLIPVKISICAPQNWSDALFPMMMLENEESYYATTRTDTLPPHRREKVYVEAARCTQQRGLAERAEKWRLRAYQTAKLADYLESKQVALIAVEEIGFANDLFRQASRLLQPDRKD